MPGLQTAGPIKENGAPKLARTTSEVKNHIDNHIDNLSGCRRTPANSTHSVESS